MKRRYVTDVTFWHYIRRVVNDQLNYATFQKDQQNYSGNHSPLYS